jgi:hypothetical protein
MTRGVTADKAEESQHLRQHERAAPSNTGKSSSVDTKRKRGINYRRATKMDTIPNNTNRRRQGVSQQQLNECRKRSQNITTNSFLILRLAAALKEDRKMLNEHRVPIRMFRKLAYAMHRQDRKEASQS